MRSVAQAPTQAPPSPSPMPSPALATTPLGVVCSHAASETVDVAIDRAYQKEMGRDAQAAEKTHWESAYYEEEDRCGTVSTPTAYDFVDVGISDSPEADGYRTAMAAEGLLDLMRCGGQPCSSPTPTPSPTPYVPSRDSPSPTPF